jgi:hypothetical protein
MSGHVVPRRSVPAMPGHASGSAEAVLGWSMAAGLFAGYDRRRDAR